MGDAGVETPIEEAAARFAALDGFEMTEEDDAEWKRPMQASGYFLIGRDAVIRWARADEQPFRPLPSADEILPLV